ncbi:MAG: hypothetical protein HQK76_12340 [Desulfobacterales bacterium]|nr:hypothetical protein [Desulfobacterales bacterium]
MNTENPIIKQAMIGTANPIDFDSPLKDIIFNLQINDREKEFLLLTGCIGIYQTSGYKPSAIEINVQASPEESMKPCSQVIIQIIDRIFRGEHIDLITELCDRMQKHNQIMPYHLLNTALNIKNETIKKAIVKIIGKRGYWLSQFKDEWKWVSDYLEELTDSLPSNIEDIFETEAYHKKRLGLFKKIRKINPSDALKLIEKTWSNENAERRKDFIQMFNIDISEEDEPFLDKALFDRSISVREEASKALTKISNSRFLKEIINISDSFTECQASINLLINPPDKFKKEWENYGILQKTQEKIGLRAWWLIQFISFIPPKHWNTRFEIDKQSLLKAALSNNEWGMGFIEGLSNACLLHNDKEWISVLWDFWFSYIPPKNNYREINVTTNFIEKLFSNMSVQDKKNRVWKIFEKKDVKSSRFHWCINDDSEFCKAIADEYMLKLQNYIRNFNLKKNDDFYIWIDTMVLFAKNLPYEYFDKALKIKLFDEKAQYSDYLKNELNKFIEIIQLRKCIVEEING